MQKPSPAGRPMVRVRRPLVCHTSDRDFDFGVPLLPEGDILPPRWKTRAIEEEHGLRLDVYRSLGLI